MNDSEDDFWNDNEVLNSVRRYEEMLKNRSKCFFDVHEFEDIIDFYICTDNFTKATIAVDHASSIYPTASSIKLRMAEILIDKRQPVKALNILDDLEYLDSEDFGIHLLRGTALNMLGKPREAQRQFEIAISLADENKASVLYSIGESFESIKQYKVAIKYFLKVIMLEPDNYYVYHDLGYCCEKLEDFDRSIAYYRKFLDEDPFSEHVWYNLGIVYSKKGDDEKALEAYDYAIAIEPGYSSPYYNKANTLASLEKYSEAIEVFQEFLEIEPKYAAAYCYMGECYEHLEDYITAMDCYAQSINLNEKFAEAWFRSGKLNSKFGVPYDAIEDFIKAHNLEEDNPEYLLSLAEEYLEIKQYKMTAKLYSKLIHMMPENVCMWDAFSQFAAINSDFDIARTIINEGLKHNPDSALLNYRMAAYFVLEEDYVEGIRLLKETLKKHPEEINYFLDSFEFMNDEEIIDIINKYGKI